MRGEIVSPERHPRVWTSHPTPSWDTPMEEEPTPPQVEIEISFSLGDRVKVQESGELGTVWWGFVGKEGEVMYGVRDLSGKMVVYGQEELEKI